MARLRICLVAVPILLLALVVPATAANGCPASASGFRAGAVDWEWEAGDPVPAPGEDLLWDVTVVEGLAIEGLSVEDLAEIFGVASMEELYGLVLDGWRGLDKNGDGAVCFKSMPTHDNGLPAYFSNFVDTNSRSNR
jgi:hypothetical protein